MRKSKGVTTILTSMILLVITITVVASILFVGAPRIWNILFGAICSFITRLDIPCDTTAGLRDLNLEAAIRCSQDRCLNGCGSASAIFSDNFRCSDYCNPEWTEGRLDGRTDDNICDNFAFQYPIEIGLSNTRIDKEAVASEIRPTCIFFFDDQPIPLEGEIIPQHYDVLLLDRTLVASASEMCLSTSETKGITNFRPTSDEYYVYSTSVQRQTLGHSIMNTVVTSRLPYRVLTSPEYRLDSYRFTFTENPYFNRIVIQDGEEIIADTGLYFEYTIVGFPPAERVSEIRIFTKENPSDIYEFSLQGPEVFTHAFDIGEGYLVFIFRGFEDISQCNVPILGPREINSNCRLIADVIYFPTLLFQSFVPENSIPNLVDVWTEDSQYVRRGIGSVNYYTGWTRTFGSEIRQQIFPTLTDFPSTFEEHFDNPLSVRSVSIDRTGEQTTIGIVSININRLIGGGTNVLGLDRNEYNRMKLAIKTIPEEEHNFKLIIVDDQLSTNVCEIILTYSPDENGWFEIDVSLIEDFTTVNCDSGFSGTISFVHIEPILDNINRILIDNLYFYQDFAD